ncbi:MAG: hypothetical protein MJZ26_13795 [Fibrobacter sp.]|nr:hypothetical protein [Fibrobacter sp.]
MIKKILPLTAAALMALTACSDDSSSSGPSVPSADSAPTCSAKKKSDNTVEMIIGMPGVSTTTITTILNGDKVTMEMSSTYSSKIPAEAIREECEENQREAEEDHDNATVTCSDRTIKIVSEEDADGASIEKIYEKAVGECQVFEKMYDEDFYEDDDDDDDDIFNNSGSSNEEPTTPDIGTPLPGDTGLGNRQGKATCKISKNSDTEFEMTVSDADTATVSISVKYIDGILEEGSTTVFNENLPQSFIDQECAEAKEDALNDVDGSIVTCEGNTISESFKMESPFNPISFMASEFVAMCNEIQETGIIPDEDEDF